MRRIDSVTPDGEGLRVQGWITTGGAPIRSCHYHCAAGAIPLQGFNLESPDLRQAFGEDAARSRFDLRIPCRDRQGALHFEVEGSRRLILPLADAAEAFQRIRPLRHQISEGVYRGEFACPADVAIESLEFECGRPKEFPAIRLAAGDAGFRQADGALLVEARLPRELPFDDLVLRFRLENGEIVLIVDPAQTARLFDPAHQLAESYFQWIEACPDDLDILELGSRARSGVTRRQRISPRHRYVGLDLKPGPNVDIVGDVHSLSTCISRASADAVFAISVFEHLAMPWKAAIEINRILRPGGRGMFYSHHSWPLHDEPFDFWRFSDQAWRALFHQASGFRVVEAALGDPARFRPDLQGSLTDAMAGGTGYLSSCCLVEKTSETRLEWDVDPASVYGGDYPA